METREFRVDVVCRQRTVYRVAAPDAEAAKHLAMKRWQRAEAGDVAGFDSCELESMVAGEVGDELRDAQDDELILRFIRERENLLARLGAGAVAAAVNNDAISAAQTAQDLGWHRIDDQGNMQPDSVRAALALERLCARKQLVCFERPRARQNERGDVRLYCTPEYLERLSTDLEVGARQLSS